MKELFASVYTPSNESYEELKEENDFTVDTMEWCLFKSTFFPKIEDDRMSLGVEKINACQERI